MSRESAIYEGWVVHRRLRPVQHGFRYRIFMPLLDLAELPEVLDEFPLWSARRPAPAWLRTADFLSDEGEPLEDAARGLVADRLGHRPAGAVRLLAHPRYLGVGFNPVSFLFCHAPSGALEAVVAEVTNTPWGERQAYVLGDRVAKELHVSPFLGMDGDYSCRATDPGRALQVHLASGDVFDATLSLRRRELEPRLLRRLLVRYPAPPLATLARIYLQALRLKLRGVPYQPHPAR